MKLHFTITLHYITLHYTTLHYTTLHYINIACLHKVILMQTEIKILVAKMRL